MAKDGKDVAIRYFACNALSNMHAVTHTRRCFKKSNECYADLPDLPELNSKLLISNEPEIWSDAVGMKEERHMFKIIPKRALGDLYMNAHNPDLTKILGCNTNVMMGMNGRLVFYVTGYNAKKNQPEEREAYMRQYPEY